MKNIGLATLMYSISGSYRLMNNLLVKFSFKVIYSNENSVKTQLCNNGLLGSSSPRLDTKAMSKTLIAFMVVRLNPSLDIGLIDSEKDNVTMPSDVNSLISMVKGSGLKISPSPCLSCDWSS